MEKKKYVKPEMLSYDIEAALPLATSSDFANKDDEPGEGYTSVEFGEGYCDKPE